MKLLPKAGNNTLISNSLLIFLIRFFPALATTFIIILFSRQLDAQLYGVYQNFWVQLYLLSTLACLGLQAFLLTYTPSFIAFLVQKLSTRFYILFFAWMSFNAGVFAYLQHRPDLSYWLPFCFLVLYSCSTIAESILIVLKRLRFVVGMNVIYTVLFFYFHWLVLNGTLYMSQLFFVLLSLLAARFIVYGIVTRRSIGRANAEQEGNYPLFQVKKLWLHLGLYDVSQMLFKWIDKFIISILLTKELSAIYFNGSVDIPFLPLLLGAVSSAVLMQLAITGQQTEKAYMLKITHQSSRMLSCVIFPLFFFFLLFRNELFLVLLSAKYLPSVPIFIMSILAIPLRAYSFTTILQNKHKGAVINTGAFMDLLLACVLMYPFYLWMGLPGIALAFVVSSYLQAGFYLYHTAKTLETTIASLLPYANWILKFVIYGSIYTIGYFFITQYFTDLIVLILGGTLTILLVAVSLGIEVKALRQRYGRTITQEKA